MNMTAVSPHAAGKQSKATTLPGARSEGAAPLRQQGATAGMPLFLHSRFALSRPHDPAEREAQHMAERVLRMPAHEAPRPGTAAAHPRPAGNNTGQPLSSAVRDFMEPRFGADFSGVRVHSGRDATHMNRALGARAFTVGQDIYFGSPAATASMALTAHELAHVMQQAGGHYQPAIQREIDPSYEVPGSGIFDVATVLGGSNLPITITFTPDVDAPYSNQIGLIQIVRLTDTAGTNVEPQSLPAARGPDLRTQAADGPGVNAGYFTDVLHNDEPARPGAGRDAPAGRFLPPQYPFGNDPAQPNPTTPGLSRPFSSGGRGAIIGYKRSDDPADIKAAEITDAPGYAAPNPANADINFDFETVAKGEDTMTKGEDTMTIYGALSWGFQIRSSVVTNEYASVSAAQSATFDAALERHRDFYVHEPVIFYFEFDSDVLNADEAAKIDSFVDYLTRNPDVRVTPTGFADNVGGRSQYNLDLSLRRAQAVRAALLARGVPAGQVSGSRRSGATERFTPDAVTDQDLDANRRGNRRVVLTFRRSRRRRRGAP